MNAITPVPPTETFIFDGHVIRIVRIESEPWFVAQDVCTALKSSNTTVALKALDRDELTKFNLGGRAGEVLVVSESGLTSLIMRSRKATTIGSTAHRFRRWVTGEVLPSIRRTGSYGMPAPALVPVDAMRVLEDAKSLRQLLGFYADRTLPLEVENAGQARQIAEQRPVVEAYEEIVEANGSRCITDAAKVIGVSPGVLFAHMRDKLREEPWVYTRPNGEEIAYQPRLNRGELEHKLVTIPRSDGTETIKIQVRVTSRGMFLLQLKIAVERAKGRLPGI